MARNKNRSFAKRQREQRRTERAAEKMARRQARGSSATDAADPEPFVEGPKGSDKPTSEEVRLAVEYAMNPRNKSARKQRVSPGATLFVGNLDATVEAHELSSLFTQAGFVVNEAFIPQDRVTGEPRGIAFVELSDSRDAKRAIETFDGMTFHSRELRVNAASHTPHR